MTSFTPPFIHLNELDQHLSNDGFGLLNPQEFFKLTNHTQNEWDILKKYWNELPPDNYLKDGGRYRKRRHTSVIIHSDTIEQVPHRPHWQPISYTNILTQLHKHIIAKLSIYWSILIYNCAINLF